MRLRRLALLLGAMLLGSPARGDDLPTEVEVRVLKTAEAELGKVERALRSQPGVNPTTATNITLPLQAAIEEDLGRGPVKLYPKALFDACLAKLKKGDSREAIGKEMVDLHRRGELAKASGGGDGVKKVASFVFDKERIKFPDPHLPPNIKAAPGEKLKGLYQICVGTDGKVSKVTTVQSISGADQSVIDQIQQNWVYKPQPVPVCTTRAFIFQFN
jgi:hypothetical protein